MKSLVDSTLKDSMMIVNISSLEILNELAPTLIQRSYPWWNFHIFTKLFKKLFHRVTDMQFNNNLDITCGKGKTVSHFSCLKCTYLIQFNILAFFCAMIINIRLLACLTMKEKKKLKRRKKNYKNKKLSIFLFNLNKLAIQRETRSSFFFLLSIYNTATSFWTPLSTLDSWEHYINHFLLISNELFYAVWARLLRCCDEKDCAVETDLGVERIDERERKKLKRNEKTKVIV